MEDTSKTQGATATPSIATPSSKGIISTSRPSISLSGPTTKALTFSSPEEEAKEAPDKPLKRHRSRHVPHSKPQSRASSRLRRGGLVAKKVAIGRHRRKSDKQEPMQVSSWWFRRSALQRVRRIKGVKPMVSRCLEPLVLI